MEHSRLYVGNTIELLFQGKRHLIVFFPFLILVTLRIHLHCINIELSLFVKTVF